MKPDVENLVRQVLTELKSIPHVETGSRQVLTLTKNGHRFLTHTQSAGNGHALYHGFTKPREPRHDADLYRLYQKAASKIESQNGQNPSIVLDYELKRHLYRNFAKLAKDRNFVDSNHTIAGRHGLWVVRGKIPVPDVRIEMKLAMETGARGPRTCHVSLPQSVSHGKTSPWTLALRSCG
jgi:hypothetical protein